MDITETGATQLLASRIKADIDEWAVRKYMDDHRTHLGASTIAEDCLNFQWLTFRWADKEDLSGRMYRLFQRGHREEQIVIDYLRNIGATVMDKDPETGEQWRISGVNGHYGGSLDGKVIMPTSYGYGDLQFLLEVKTNGTGTAFTKLTSDGVQMQKPTHYGQQCAYGFESGLTHSLYVNTNKNDDDMHIEIVKLDWDLGRRLREKADRVIASQEPLGKIAKSATHKLCKYCKFVGVCHDGKAPEKSCRSCKFASPVENKQWHCSKWNAIIPNKDAIKKGCAEWVAIING